AELLPRIQQALPPDWALLDFWWLDLQTFVVFLVTREQFDVIRLSVPLDEGSTFRKHLDDLFWYTATLQRPDGWDGQVWDDLHRYLFAPLRPRLKGFDGLYLVPHGCLSMVPLHAARYLAPGRGRHFLADDFAIAYL